MPRIYIRVADREPEPKPTSAELADQVEAFIAGGGFIQYYPGPGEGAIRCNDRKLPLQMDHGGGGGRYYSHHRGRPKSRTGY